MKNKTKGYLILAIVFEFTCLLVGYGIGSLLAAHVIWYGVLALVALIAYAVDLTCT